MNRIIKKLRTNDIINVLCERTYFSFALAVLFSQLAFNMTNVTLIFLIFYLTRSNLSVSALVLTFLLPQVLLSFFGGVVADLQNKKIILLYGNLLRAGALLVLFFNSSSVVLTYLMSIIISVITQFYVPAEAPMIPNLVKKENLIAANSLFGMGFFITVLLGYVLAGPLINLLGHQYVFLFISSLFFIAAYLTWRIPNTFIKINEEKSQVDYNAAGIINSQASRGNELGESISLLRRTRKVGGAFFLLMFSQVIILILATIVPGYASSILKVKPENLSLLLFAPAALGMIISAIVIASLFKNYDKNRLMNYGVFISGLSLSLFPFTGTIASSSFIRALNSQVSGILTIDVTHIVIFLSFFAGFANALIFVPSQTIIQEIIPEDFRSRIYGLLFAAIGLVSLIPILAAGTIADTIGVGSVLLGVGIIIILIGFSRIGINLHTGREK